MIAFQFIISFRCCCCLSGFRKKVRALKINVKRVYIRNNMMNYLPLILHFATTCKNNKNFSLSFVHDLPTVADAISLSRSTYIHHKMLLHTIFFLQIALIFPFVCSLARSLYIFLITFCFSVIVSSPHSFSTILLSVGINFLVRLFFYSCIQIECQFIECKFNEQWTTTTITRTGERKRIHTNRRLETEKWAFRTRNL